MFSANAMCEENGEETVRAFAFYPSEVEVIEDWCAFGLKGTASHSWVVEDVFVPDERSFVVGSIKWPVSNPMYRLSFALMASITGAAVRFGMARRFFELAEPFARPEVRDEVQQMAAEASQHRLLFHVLAKHWWSRIVAGQGPSDSEERVLIQTNKRLVNDTIRTAQRAFPYLRMRVLWEREPINRVYRDLVTSAHAIDLIGR